MSGEVIDDELRIVEVRLIAQSTHLPVDDRELAVLGDYLDAFEAQRVTDCALYVQARAKAKAYIAQRLVERPRWNSGVDGSVEKMTEELREKLMAATAVSA